MSAITPGEVRLAALAMLGPHDDERTRDVLRHADLSLAEAATSWESSGGPVRGHRVTLAVDAARLGGIRATPHLLDELHAALARAIAGRAGEALDSLEVCWGHESAGAVAVGYRDAPPAGRTSLAEALAAYLGARGEAALASAVKAGRVEAVATRVDVTPATDDAALFDDPGATDALEDALRDLLGPGSQVAIQR